MADIKRVVSKIVRMFKSSNAHSSNLLSVPLHNPSLPSPLVGEGALKGWMRGKKLIKPLTRLFETCSNTRGEGKASSQSKQPLPLRMSIISPRAISWPSSKLAGAFNRKSITRQIDAELLRRNLENPIIWTSLPTSIDVIEAFQSTPVIYYCGDDFGALEGVDHAPVKRMEDRLSARANTILTASENLAQKFSTAKTTHLPHGVDLNLFQMPVPRPQDLPDSSKVAGFYGSISSWIDVEAITKTAKLMPDWTFVLIGAIRTDITCLKAVPNIQLLGEKPHNALPAYVQHWNVSLLPFKNTPQIQACNPLKLREYLSVGTPIVSTYFKALEPYLDLVKTAEYGPDYRKQILLAAMDTARNSHRSASVAHESWDQRAADIETILERFE